MESMSFSLSTTPLVPHHNNIRYGFKTYIFDIIMAYNQFTEYKIMFTRDESSLKISRLEMRFP